MPKKNKQSIPTNMELYLIELSKISKILPINPKKNEILNEKKKKNIIRKNSAVPPSELIVTSASVTMPLSAPGAFWAKGTGFGASATPQTVSKFLFTGLIYMLIDWFAV